LNTADQSEPSNLVQITQHPVLSPGGLATLRAFVGVRVGWLAGWPYFPLGGLTSPQPAHLRQTLFTVSPPTPTSPTSAEHAPVSKSISTPCRRRGHRSPSRHGLITQATPATPAELSRVKSRSVVLQVHQWYLCTSRGASALTADRGPLAAGRSSGVTNRFPADFDSVQCNDHNPIGRSCIVYRSCVSAYAG
jgi:hypothetical protein